MMKMVHLWMYVPMGCVLYTAAPVDVTAMRAFDKSTTAAAVGPTVEERRGRWGMGRQ